MRILFSAALVVFLFSGACASQDPTPTPSVIPEGAVQGHVVIGPLCPVSPCPTPTVNPYQGIEAVLTPAGGEVVRLDLRPDGTFAAFIPSGTYELTIEPCIHLGCEFSLPKTVEITPAGMTNVAVDIDTGIR
jgi:hypothetical protein